MEKPEKEKKPAVSSDEIIRILTTSDPIQEPEKRFAPGEGMDWYPEKDEDEFLKRWLRGDTGDIPPDESDKIEEKEKK